MELGAETLAHLKAVPLKGTIAGEAKTSSAQPSPPSSLPGTPGTADINTPPISSPEQSPGEALPKL